MLTLTMAFSLQVLSRVVCGVQGHLCVASCTEVCKLVGSGLLQY